DRAGLPDATGAVGGDDAGRPGAPAGLAAAGVPGTAACPLARPAWLPVAAVAPGRRPPWRAQHRPAAVARWAGPGPPHGLAASVPHRAALRPGRRRCGVSGPPGGR